MKLQPITPSQLTLLEASQFINRQLTNIRSLGGPEIFTDNAMNDFLEKLDTRRSDFIQIINVVRKNKETIKIEEQDNKRDRALIFLHKLTAAYEFSGVEEKQDAARNLKTLYSTYKNLADLNYEAESQGIDSLLSALGSSEYEPMVEFLNLDEALAHLQDTNNAFKALFDGRSQEVARKETFDARLFKKEMLALYSEFATYVLTMAKLSTSPALFTEVLAVMNSNRKYYADMLARRNGKGVAAEPEITQQ